MSVQLKSCAILICHIQFQATKSTSKAANTSLDPTTCEIQILDSQKISRNTWIWHNHNKWRELNEAQVLLIQNELLCYVMFIYCCLLQHKKYETSKIAIVVPPFAVCRVRVAHARLHCLDHFVRAFIWKLKVI